MFGLKKGVGPKEKKIESEDGTHMHYRLAAYPLERLYNRIQRDSRSEI